MNKVSHSFRVTGLGFLLCGLMSCAENTGAIYPSYKKYTEQSNDLNMSKNHILLNVYSYQQTTNYTCVPAAVMSLMHYYGKLGAQDMNQATEERIASEMGTSIEGTSQPRTVTWLQKHGFTVKYGQEVSVDQLIANLRKGIPTIVIWNDWSGHAMLLAGYSVKGAMPDETKDVLFFADPSTSSYVVENGHTQYGINTLTPSQLELNWFFASHFFNPSHTATGMYIEAVPS
jgi:hypothetical protein